MDISDDDFVVVEKDDGFVVVSSDNS